jgi:hypothetical protein
MPFQIQKTDTLLGICNRALQSVGFPAQTDVAGSIDPAVIQMVQAANQAATDLLGMHYWEVMHKTYTLVIGPFGPSPPSSALFPLPEDFLMFFDQTQWNNSQQLPMIGPVLPQDWQRVTVRTADFVTRLLWRVRDGQWEIKSPPSDAQTISMEYISQAMVQDQDDSTLFKNFADKNGDIFLLDCYLIYYLTKAKWLEVKGFDSAAAMRDFQVSFEQRFRQEEGAPVLSTIGGRTNYRYLDYWNVPDTGYGS